MARKGLPSKYAKMGFKKGWKAYKASKSKRRKSSNPRTSTTSRKVKRRMPRRKTRRKRGFTIPLAPIAGLAAGLAEPITNMISDPSPRSIRLSLNHIGLIYTGYNAVAGRFQPDALAKGLAPLVIGCLVHKFVGGPPLNLNRTLAASGVPFVRI